MDNGSQHALTLVRLPEGGFLVQDAYRPEAFNAQHLACTTIDEALKFMRDKIQPIPATSNPVSSQERTDVANSSGVRDLGGTEPADA